MKILNDRYVFDFAIKEDNEQILKILEENDFTGKISILYTRRPDAYSSFMAEGKEVLFITCKDIKNHNAIVGFGACSINECFVNGEKQEVGYLFGLRSSKEYLKKINFLHHSYDYLKEILENRNIKYFYTTILEENYAARKLLEKERKYMPKYEYVCDYIVYSVKTKQKVKQNEYDLINCTDKDINDILIFYHKNGKKLNFFPLIDVEIIKKIGINNFYFLKDKEKKILCCGAVWDQKNYKQHIIKNYSKIFKYVQFFSFLFPLFGYPSLPKIDNILNYYTISYFCVENNDPDLFQLFIKEISKKYSEYSFFITGLSDQNFLNKSFEKIPKINYKSRIYLVNWEKKENIKETLDKNYPIYLECGML